MWIWVQYVILYNLYSYNNNIYVIYKVKVAAAYPKKLIFMKTLLYNIEYLAVFKQYCIKQKFFQKMLYIMELIIRDKMIFIYKY